MSRPNSAVRRKPSSSGFEVAVVGGGLAGLLATIRLDQSGRKVALVAPPRSQDRRTTALFGRSVGVIKRAGVWPAIKDHAQPVRSIRIVDATNRLLRAPEVLFKAEEIGLPALGYNVPNEPLLAGLEQIVADKGIPVEPSAARIFQFGARHATIDTDSGRSLTAKLVVAADGQHSKTRRSSGIEMASTELGQTALVCVLEHELPHGDGSCEFHTDAGPFTFVPLTGRRSALVWVLRPRDAERLARLSSRDLESAIELQSHSILGKLAISEDVQLFALRSGVSLRLTANRLALLGEAAHVIPPIGAQGFNLTIRDIETLVELLGSAAGDVGSAQIMATYEAKRRGDIGLRQAAVGLFNASLLSDWPPAQLVRSFGLFALARVPPLRRLALAEGIGGR